METLLAVFVEISSVDLSRPSLDSLSRTLLFEKGHCLLTHFWLQNEKVKNKRKISCVHRYIFFQGKISSNGFHTFISIKK